MGEAFHTISVHAPQEEVWNFVCDMSSWAPQVPGYISHSVINTSISIWVFTIPVGFVRKKVHIQVEIIDWREPSGIEFVLEEINAKFSGKGFFQTERLDSDQTKIIGYLQIDPKGSRRTLYEPFLVKVLPQLTKELTENVGTAIQNKSNRKINRSDSNI
ncbi:CoxG family protein [Rossellomorea aquimaris]|uniref:CoxG family protein n=1 Tax=Rossellomorea aquimaris TaxID=189382 RepID=UPI0007D049D1|nr:SRPBCC family protein [Rossellomorea aquimaris]